MDRDTILGGSPWAVALRLLLLSLVVGIVLSALGITPDNIFYRLNIVLERLYNLGFRSVEWVLRYILLGAIVVIPVWLIARTVGVFRSGRTETGDTSTKKESD